MKPRLVVVTLVVVIGITVGVVIAKRQVSKPTVSEIAKFEPQAETRLPASAAPRAPDAVPPAVTSDSPAPAEAAAPSTKPNKTAPATAAAKGKPQPKDELARVALSFVGADPEAEEYWIGAINDPNLSNHERQDLIEDLNEDGLSDPHHPTAQDLPLILNRLLLIEELAPGAMDQVNADAFQEAYKDLSNLAALALGGGQEVK